MALLTDPDFLTGSIADDGTKNVFINTWKNDPNNQNLAAFPFPVTPITDESFELIDGWDFGNDSTRYLLRTAGWTVKNQSAGAVTQKWAGIIGLGSVPGSAQLYYDQLSGAINVQLTGQVNQAVQILSDSNGDGNYDSDNRSSFKLFVLLW